MKNLSTALKTVTKTSVTAIAKEIGVPQSTLSRQAKENDIPTSVLVNICKAYNVSIIDVLLEAELLTEKEARSMRGIQSIREYTELELAEEFYRRELEKQAEKDREYRRKILSGFNPEIYADHKYLADKYGNNPTQKQLRLAARHVKPQDDIEEIYPD